MSLFNRCYPNVSGAILILAIFVFCPYVCPQCQLPRYEIKKWLDCFKCSMVEIEVSISGYGSALLPVLLSAGSPTQPTHRDGCLRLHGLLEFSPFPPQSQHCYLLIFYSKYLYRHGGQGGRGWGSSSRVEELALALSQAGLVFTIGQWRSVGHDSIAEHQHPQGCSETMTKTKTNITVKPTKHQTSPLLKGVTASALLPITVLSLL